MEGGRDGRLVVGGRERNEGKDLVSSYTCTHNCRCGGREEGREVSYRLVAITDRHV